MPNSVEKPSWASTISLFASLVLAFFALVLAPQAAHGERLRWLSLDEQGADLRQEFHNSSVGRRALRVESLLKASLEGVRARRDYGRVVSISSIAQFFNAEIEEEFGPIEDARSLQSGELEYFIKLALSSLQLGTDSAVDILAITAIRYFQNNIDLLAQREVGNPANKLRRLERWIREVAPSFRQNEPRYNALARLYEYLTKESLASQLAEQEATALLCTQLLTGGH